MIVRSKGTVLSLSVADVLTPISQVLSLELPEGENETFEADFLDNEEAGIPYRATGRTEGGELGYEIFLDPALAAHQAITDLLLNPPSEPVAASVAFADEDETEWDFEVAGVSLGVSVALKDGLKGKGKFKLSGTIAYPS